MATRVTNVSEAARLAKLAESLRSFRKQLDSGDLSVQQFVEQAKPQAKELLQLIGGLAGRSSADATFANQFLGVLPEAGFKHTGGTIADPTVKVALPQKFEEQARQELLPENLPEDQRQAILDEIPRDIGFDTDRFNIEREGIRQKLQQTEDIETAKTSREERLVDLGALLRKQGEEAFDINQAPILEQLQARGLAQTSELESSFARERRRQSDVTQNILTQQSLSDREADIAGALSAGELQRDFQSSGLSREFGLEDLARSNALARELAILSQPQARGKSRGEKAVEGIEAGASVVGAIRG